MRGILNAIFVLVCASVSKRVLLPKLSYENDFDCLGNTFLHEWFRAKTRFDTEAKATRKWTRALSDCKKISRSSNQGGKLQKITISILQITINISP